MKTGSGGLCVKCHGKGSRKGGEPNGKRFALRSGHFIYFGIPEIPQRFSGYPKFLEMRLSSSVIDDIRHTEKILRTRYTRPRSTKNRKGTPGESRGRKAMGLRPQLCRGDDCQAAEVSEGVTLVSPHNSVTTGLDARVQAFLYITATGFRRVHRPGHMPGQARPRSRQRSGEQPRRRDSGPKGERLKCRVIGCCLEPVQRAKDVEWHSDIW